MWYSFKNTVFFPDGHEASEVAEDVAPVTQDVALDVKDAAAFRDAGAAVDVTTLSKLNTTESGLLHTSDPKR